MNILVLEINILILILMQQEEIIATFIKWLIECDSTEEKTLPDAGYVLDVWIPEVVILLFIQIATVTIK